MKSVKQQTEKGGEGGGGGGGNSKTKMKTDNKTKRQNDERQTGHKHAGHTSGQGAWQSVNVVLAVSVFSCSLASFSFYYAHLKWLKSRGGEEGSKIRY